MNCKKVKQLLSEYADEALSEEQKKQINAHLETCGECKKDVAEKLNAFLKVHQENRERAKDVIEQYHIKRK